ncbi:DMT family transporter [Phreatobacter aquaticus]|uniref:DMT family transporter n=1 Tax=Phreatobacter aquaticus TaxID=2570229 RepID=A0A4D7QF73_9HYPH|nr:DMT family transporter [Phreatobacter aquaticus]
MATEPAEARTEARSLSSGTTAVLAIALVLLSSLLYLFGYALSKTLANRYGMTALQVTFLRCVLVLGVTFLALGWAKSGVTWERIWRPTRVWEQRGAAAALVLSNAMAVYAYSLMPVTAASALGFTAPLILTALGGLMLGERISAGRWLGALIGFAGMLLIVKPTENPSLLGIFASVGAAAFYAIYQIVVRRLREVASSVDTAMQVAVVGVVILAVPMVWFWTPLSLEGFAMGVLFTVVQTVALFSISTALRLSETSKIAPWQFSGLIWAMLLDAVMFSVAPSLGSLAGAACIILGGLLAQGGLLRRLFRR